MYLRWQTFYQLSIWLRKFRSFIFFVIFVSTKFYQRIIYFLQWVKDNRKELDGNGKVLFDRGEFKVCVGLLFFHMAEYVKEEWNLSHPVWMQRYYIFYFVRFFFIFENQVHVYGKGHFEEENQYETWVWLMVRYNLETRPAKCQHYIASVIFK